MEHALRLMFFFRLNCNPSDYDAPQNHSKYLKGAKHFIVLVY